MLKVNDLQSQLETAIRNTVTPAVKQMVLQLMPEKTKAGDELSDRISQTFDDLVAESLSTLIAEAIDYYVKNASITGTIITTGSPVTQVANITSMPTPTLNGKIPNTLGIS
jgi:hypothetical protein